MPKVSIIVPVYNVAQYLPRTVDSFRTQTEKDLEIILVDDGATDTSGQICDQLAAEDPRIRVIHKANGGLSSARNAGLDIASGSYIMFVDGDDYLAPHAVESLLSVLNQQEPPEDIDFVQFLYEEVSDDPWHPKAQHTHVVLHSGVSEFFRQLYQLGGVAASSCTKLFRADLFQSVRFRHGIRHEDEQLMTQLLPKCRNVLYTDLVLYAYVMRNGSIVHSQFSPQSMDIFPIMEERIEVLRSLGLDDLVQETHRRVFQTAAMQYCLARRGGYHNESKELNHKLCALAQVPDLPLSGQYRLLYHLSRLTSFAPELYYQIRRFCGKS